METELIKRKFLTPHEEYTRPLEWENNVTVVKNNRSHIVVTSDEDQ